MSATKKKVARTSAAPDVDVVKPASVYASLIQKMTSTNFDEDVFGQMAPKRMMTQEPQLKSETSSSVSGAGVATNSVAVTAAPAAAAAATADVKQQPLPPKTSTISRQRTTPQNAQASSESSIKKIFGEVKPVAVAAAAAPQPSNAETSTEAPRSSVSKLAPAVAEVELAPVESSTSGRLLREFLHPKLVRTVTEKLHIERLTRIQQLAWDAMMDREKNILIRSETGSGKTFAYMGPLLQRLLTECDTEKIDRTAGTLIIVLAPTRELVEQVANVTQTLLQHAQFVTVGAIHGGDNRHKEKARLRKGIHILVATPGRLLDHLKTTEAFEHRRLQTLVLDEADRLLDMGFERAIREIMEMIHPIKRVLVSATITGAVERLSHFALHDPLHIGETEDTFQVPASLRQHFAIVPAKHRLATLISFLRSQLDSGCKKIVVFMSTSDSTEFHYLLLSRLQNPFSSRKRMYAVNRNEAVQRPKRRSFKKMTEAANSHLEFGEDPEDVVTFDDDHGDEQEPEQLDAGDSFLNVSIYKLHGNMSQVDRSAVFHSFKHGPEQAVLICTDVAARGLDMPQIDWIVHYDPPSDERCYVHRVGRTARIGRVGDSILFLMDHEAGYAQYLSKFIAMPIEEKKHEILLYYLAKLDPASHHSWMQSTASLERKIATTIREDQEGLAKVSLFAYQSYVRAYSGYPREVRQYFDNSLLHLGHIAHSFGIDQKPSDLRKTLQGLVRDERKITRDTSRFKQGERMEVDTKEVYHSSLVNKGLKQSRDYHEVKRATTVRVAKPLEFTEFDA